jgi:hypothetical protein
MMFHLRVALRRAGVALRESTLAIVVTASRGEANR